jgi:hypothetical protein
MHFENQFVLRHFLRQHVRLFVSKFYFHNEESYGKFHFLPHFSFLIADGVKGNRRLRTDDDSPSACFLMYHGRFCGIMDSVHQSNHGQCP